MQLQISLFGITRDIVGQNTLLWPSDTSLTVDELMTALKLQYPALADLSSILVAVNEEYAEPNQAILPNDHIALIPPVSGG